MDAELQDSMPINSLLSEPYGPVLIITTGAEYYPDIAVVSIEK